MAIYANFDDAREAIAYQKRSLAINQKLYPDGVHPDIASNYGNLGLAYKKLGDAHQAINYYQQSLAINQQLYPDA